MHGTVARKLTTILAADVEGYSRLMAEDEVATLVALRACRAVFGRLIERHGGRIVNTAGDGLLADFPSVVEAVQCAVEVQRELTGDASRAMRFRIGIHLGDVMVDGGDLFGEGVNLAARLQALAEPGGILISQPVYQQVRSKLRIGFEYRGERRPKNFPEDVPIYGVVLEHQPAPAAGVSDAPQPPSRQSHPAPAAKPARPGISRRAAQYGVILAGLLAIDVGTGGVWWAQWPALGMGMAFGLEAAPLLARDWITGQLVRGAVVGLGLAAINALTWQGYPWALWPIGAIAALILLRAVSRRGEASL